jgi:polyisoprenyl-teichoic acid--peptidoglycan teichoic acid transferase
MPSAHAVRPRHRSWSQRLVLAIGCCVSVLCLGTAGALTYYYELWDDITRYDVELSRAAKGAPRNYLVVGSDSREGVDPDDPDAAGFLGDGGAAGRRSDTIMVLRVDPKSTRASLLSLPRDLWVPIAGTGSFSRINSAYGLGPQTLIDTIREALGIEIHHYVEVDFAGFKALVEAIDGVTMWFDTPVRDARTGLDVRKTGCVTLGPLQALGLARSRHLEYLTESGWESDPTGDLGRITRQQIFIRRAIKQAIGTGLSDVGTLTDLVQVGVDHVGLDPRLKVRDIIGLGRRFSSFDADSLRTYALPVEGFRTSGGASVVRMIERDAERILNVFRGRPAGELTPGLVEVTVLNGSGVTNQATDVASALSEVGFAIEDVSDAGENPAVTTIFHAPGDQVSAVLLARYLSSGATLVVDDDLSEGETILVTATDFTTVHDQPSPRPDVVTTTSTIAAPTATSTPESTTTTVIGHAVGAPPPGVGC